GARVVADLRDGHLGPPPAAPERVAAGVRGHSQDPVLERPARAVPRQGAMDLEKDFLHDLLRVLVTAYETSRQAEDPVLEAAHQIVEGRRIACRGTGDEEGLLGAAPLRGSRICRRVAHRDIICPSTVRGARHTRGSASLRACASGRLTSRQTKGGRAWLRGSSERPQWRISGSGLGAAKRRCRVARTVSRSNGLPIIRLPVVAANSRRGGLAASPARKTRRRARAGFSARSVSRSLPPSRRGRA